MGMFVDGLIIAAHLKLQWKRLRQLIKWFQYKALGPLGGFLNVEITHTAADGLFLSQCLCVNDALKLLAESTGARTAKLRRRRI